jgi:hypothetical protein
MDIDIDSKIAKFYKWFFNTKKLPTDGCLFGKKLILAIFFCVPFYIICVPQIILNKFKIKDILKCFPRFIAGIVYYIILLFSFCIGDFLYNIKKIPFYYNTNGSINDNCIVIGYLICGMFFAGASIIGVSYLALSIAEKLKSKSKPTVKKPNLFIEYFKSIKDKYCFKINWVTKEK